jgi:hypothetical protein
MRLSIRQALDDLAIRIGVSKPIAFDTDGAEFVITTEAGELREVFCSPDELPTITPADLAEARAEVLRWALSA